MARRHWLVKSEPDVYSIADLERDGSTSWEGVRNFQARNLMREMRRGDRVLFHHSSATPPGIAGVCEVAREAYPDPTQFDPRSPYHDETAKRDDPRWLTVDLRFVERFRELLPLPELREDPELAGMELLRRGSRLSVQPVTAEQFARILRLARGRRRRS